MDADSLTPAAPGDARLLGRAWSDWARGPMYDECVNSFRTHWCFNVWGRKYTL